MSFLKKIRSVKEKELIVRKKNVPLSELKKGLKKSSKSFKKAISRGKGDWPRVIAEFKRGSPSRGLINKNADLSFFVDLYDGFASAVSVLTEENYFFGSLRDLEFFSSFSKKPVLRKDFIFDEYQVFESRRFGADAILLIAGFLSSSELNKLIFVAESLGMDCLVEFFDDMGFDEALKSNAKIIGVNNRNLVTLGENIGVTEKYFSLIPESKRKELVLVSESTISGRSDVLRVERFADALLVGTAIMGSEFPRAKLKEICGVPLIKICGITRVRDAELAVELGADVIGLNFYEKSPRFVSEEIARNIVSVVKGKALIAGVFVNESKSRIEELVAKLGLDFVQLSGSEPLGFEVGFSVPVIKTFHVVDEHSLDSIDSCGCDFVMVDSFVNGLFGGTGRMVNVNLLNKSMFVGKNLVFSGGLSPKNVVGVIKKFRPFMVDVCSGVEESPGKKKKKKLREFISRVNGF